MLMLDRMEASHSPDPMQNFGEIRLCMRELLLQSSVSLSKKMEISGSLGTGHPAGELDAPRDLHTRDLDYLANAERR